MAPIGSGTAYSIARTFRLNSPASSNALLVVSSGCLLSTAVSATLSQSVEETDQCSAA